MRTKIKPFFNLTLKGRPSYPLTQQGRPFYPLKRGLRKGLIIIIFLAGLIFVPQAIAEEKAESKIQTATQKTPDTTRIVISTSGPVKFDSHWSDNPYRLIVEFKSKNVVGRIDKEAVVNQGLIKKITASYFSGAKFKAIKTLTFELARKVPYKIWQEGNTILLDIQAPLESPGFSVGARETPAEDESNKVLKKLEAMEVALKQTQGIQSTSEVIDSEVTNKTLKHIALGKTEQGRAILSESESVKVRKNTMGIILWFVGLVSISGLGFAFWRKYVVVRTKNLTERIRELKLELEKKDALLEQVEIIRKTIEKTVIEKEEVYKQLKLELQEKSRLFEQEVAIRSEKEKALSEKEKEYEHLKETSESLKDVLVKRSIARQLTLPEGKGELWILGKSQERRSSPRLTLTKDFHNTVILKIELQGISGNIKSFAENISSVGLCFEITKELDDKHPINLRLFFYGGRVPIIKVQGRIVWKKIIESSNYYGLCFDWLGEKEKLEINTYIESKRGRS